MHHDWKQVVSFFIQGAGARFPADEIIETHAAKVFLIGDLAYKIKKPVNLGYLDFSTPEKRHSALEKEFERNRNYAPSLYLGVTGVRRKADGTLRLGGEGEVVEYALVMRRFPKDALLSGKSTQVQGELAEALGRQIAQIHIAAPIVPDAWPSELEYALRTNANRLAEFGSMLGKGDVNELLARTEQAYAQERDLLVARARNGFVRRCHGDLHPRNIFLEEGRPVPLDCVEFDDQLSDIDVLYDSAFLLMDLLQESQVDGANRLLNAYLDEALRGFAEDFLRGLSLMPLFLSMRAAIRAHVTAQMGGFERAQIYLKAAQGHLKSTEAVLLAVGGLSGTGKTHFARSIAPSTGKPPGAVVLRSDEIRKRRWKVRPLDRLPAQAYTPAETKHVYELMHDEARMILRTGHSVILDAAYLSAEERAACRSLAEAEKRRFRGIWLQAPAEILRRRVSERKGDASDAGLEVLERQMVYDTGDIDWERIDTSERKTSAAEYLKAQESESKRGK